MIHKRIIVQGHGEDLLTSFYVLAKNDLFELQMEKIDWKEVNTSQEQTCI